MREEVRQRRFRIVALDLDGTLLDSAKRLSEANRSALACASAQGALIVPTTGRFFGMMPAAVRDLPFVRYAITVNGAQVYDRETDTAIVREEIPVDEARAIMALLDRHDVIYDCYRENWGWMTKTLQDRADEYATDEHYVKMVREFRRPVEELKAFLSQTAERGGVQKIMLFSRLDDSEAKELAAIRAEMAEEFPDIKVTSSCWNDLEFNAAGAHKGNSLRRFAESLNLTLDDCIAFGDGLNDLSMIEAAGCGVAMSNAVEEVKRAATLIACSNDEDGVARVLNEIYWRAPL